MSDIHWVEVVLSDGWSQSFPNGRSWIVAENGGLTILDENAALLANVAANRWAVVGFRDFTSVHTKD